MKESPQIGERITDKSAAPDEHIIRGWSGPNAFGQWVALQRRIEASYPGVFAQDSLYGGTPHTQMATEPRTLQDAVYFFESPF